MNIKEFLLCFSMLTQYLDRQVDVSTRVATSSNKTITNTNIQTLFPSRCRTSNVGELRYTSLGTSEIPQREKSNSVIFSSLDLHSQQLNQPILFQWCCGPKTDHA